MFTLIALVALVFVAIAVGAIVMKIVENDPTSYGDSTCYTLYDPSKAVTIY